jgi:NtrC-family two-component system response regulator AlgB
MKREFHSEALREQGASAPDSVAEPGSGLSAGEVLVEEMGGRWVIASRNPRMRRAIDRARQLLFEHRVLILEGERGCGKSLLARVIHDSGQRAGGGLTAISCNGAAAEKVHRAMNGAVEVVGDGNFCAATIVLERIDQLSSALLSEVLEVMARRSQRLFSAALSGVRVIATTRTPISGLGEAQGVSEDLVQRARRAPMIVTVPPLRERREDILVMAERFLSRQGEEEGRERLAFTVEARRALTAYAWPGNIRELRSTVERAAVIARGSTIDVVDLALPVAGGEALWPDGYPSLDALEKMYILRVIRETSTLEEAAAILKVDITTLWRKRRRYGI